MTSGSTHQNIYETDSALAEYLLLHYGDPETVLPYSFGPADALNFPVRCISECLDLERLPATRRALDLGCAVGRATFELTRLCTSVTGVDFSRQFIHAALELKRHGHVGYNLITEGVLHTRSIARVPDDIERSRAHFERADAMNLHSDLANFEIVLAANLLCRLTDPQKFLERLPRLVKRGGQLILTTPCTWQEEFTHHTKWLGGFEDENGDPVRTIDGLHNGLDRYFRLIRTRDLPFLIREHSRKYQWSVALATVWERY